MTALLRVAIVGAVIIMLLVDLGVFHRRDHAVGFVEVFAWTGFRIVHVLIFNVLVGFAYEEPARNRRTGRS